VTAAFPLLTGLGEATRGGLLPTERSPLSRGDFAAEGDTIEGLIEDVLVLEEFRPALLGDDVVCALFLGAALLGCAMGVVDSGDSDRFVAADLVLFVVVVVVVFLSAIGFF
jgi:hypothetical protein